MTTEPRRVRAIPTPEYARHADTTGYEDGLTNRAPRAWILYPAAQRDLRHAYRKGYMRGMRARVGQIALATKEETPS